MSSEVAMEIYGSRWKRYPAYRDSGVEWLREVPEGWGASKIIRYAYLKTGGTPDRKNMAYWENGTINWISSGEVNKKKIFETNNKITSDGLANSNAMILPINSIMVALNGQGKTKGTVAILKIESSCNQSLAAFICDEKKLHFNYLFYYLESKYKELRGLVGDSSRDGLSLGHLKSIYSPLPPIIKQRAIAAFLDRETGRIDTLIEKKERQVELLQEKRAALISHAVTKGLDLDVKMKDSGVEWIGEVPDHWEVKKIMRMCLVKRGASPRPIDDPVYFDDEGEYSWVRISDVTASAKYLQTTEQKLSALGKSKSVPLEPGELFLSIAGSVGKPIITAIKCCIHDGFVYFVDLKQNREYMFFLFSGRELYKGLGKLGTQLNLNTDTVGDIKIPVSPLSEQRAIAAFLDHETGRIDILTTKIRESISKLREYRTALISAAVTGKIDVREGV